MKLMQLENQTGTQDINIRSLATVTTIQLISKSVHDPSLREK